MSGVEDFKFTVKVVISKQKRKVLYAEADSDFTDVLLCFLTLPLGTIVRLLNKHYGDQGPVIFGSLTTLYKGLLNLDSESGFNETMDLLRGSVVYWTPLTDLILNERQMDHFTVKCEIGTSCGGQIEKQINSNTIKMTVIAIFQRSTNKVLFAEADAEFVDFLFSLLTIPLGGVECLLGGSTSDLKNIENLYMSIANINGEAYMKAEDKKIMLLEPKLSFGYISKNQILPLTKEKPCECDYYSLVKASPVKSPKGPGNYVKGPRTFMVTDDLTVTPMRTTSGISVLNSLNIPLSDVKELELLVGLEEVLSILKASHIKQTTKARTLRMIAGVRAVVFVTGLIICNCSHL